MNLLKKLWLEPTTISPDMCLLCATISLGSMTLSHNMNPNEQYSLWMHGLLAIMFLIFSYIIDKRKVKKERAKKLIQSQKKKSQY